MFRTIFTTLTALLKSGVCATQSSDLTPRLIDLEELLALFLKFKSVIFSASLGGVQIQTM